MLMLVCAIALIVPYGGEVVPGTSCLSSVGGGPLCGLFPDEVDDGRCVGNAV